MRRLFELQEPDSFGCGRSVNGRCLIHAALGYLSCSRRFISQRRCSCS